MRDTTDQLLKASIKVFKQYGYLKATTKAIASEAEVAEVTLYRKFKTKKLLFEATLRKYLDLSLEETPIDPKTSSVTFIPELLKNRLQRMSEQIDFIHLLIKESLSNTLPSEFQFERYVQRCLSAVIKEHLEYAGCSDNKEEITRMIIGTLLSYVLIPRKTPFNALSEKEKETLINAHSNMIIKAMNYLR